MNGTYPTTWSTQGICGLGPKTEEPLDFPSPLGELTTKISDNHNIDPCNKHEGEIGRPTPETFNG